MNNQNQQKPATEQIQQQNKKFTSPKQGEGGHKPKWLIPVIIIVGVIVLGLVVWAGYSIFKPEPKPEAECQKAEDCGMVQECGMTWECQEGKCHQISKECPPSDITANWKTYRNEEYGFELKYPDNFNLIQEKAYAGFSPCTEFDAKDKYFVCGFVTFSELDSPEADTVEELFSMNYLPTEAKIIEKSKINDFYLLKIGLSAAISQYYLLYDESLKRGIEITNREGLIEEKTFNQILSTFKFID